MQTVVLSRKFGDILGRIMGEELREEVMQRELPVQLDFSGIKEISHTFGEEFFGKLIDQWGRDRFYRNIILKNLKPQNELVFREVLEKRRMAS